MTTDELKTEIDKAVSHLYTLRDEARVRLHLAGMDAKDAWHALEPHIDDAERLAAQASETTLHAITATAKKVEDFISKF